GRVTGSPFNDVVDGGLGSDTLPGGLGLDVFKDASAGEKLVGVVVVPPTDVDTLVEQFDSDIGLYNNRLVVGPLLKADGTPFAAGLRIGPEGTDAGDRFRARVAQDPAHPFRADDLKGRAAPHPLR